MENGQLVAAIGTLWTLLTTVIGAALRFLLEERKTRDAFWEKRVADEEAKCNERIMKLEAKLDESTEIIRTQNHNLQKQLDTQATTMQQQQEMIVALQRLGKGTE